MENYLNMKGIIDTLASNELNKDTNFSGFKNIKENGFNAPNGIDPKTYYNNETNNLINMIERAREDDSDEAKKFLQNADFIGKIFAGDIKSLSHISLLEKVIDSKALLIKVFTFLAYRQLPNETKYYLLVTLANNYVTIMQGADATRRLVNFLVNNEISLGMQSENGLTYPTKDQVIRMISDYFNQKLDAYSNYTKQEISWDTTSQLMNDLKWALNTLEENFNKPELLNEMKKTYNAVFNASNTNYIPYRGSLEHDIVDAREKIRNLETELKNQKSLKLELEDKIKGLEKSVELKTKEKNNYEIDNKNLTKALNEQRGENFMLKQALEKEQLKTNKAENTATKTQEKLQKLIQGVENVKSGLGSRGVNKYKKMVTQIAAQTKEK